MVVKDIIYYTGEEYPKEAVSLRNLCIKDTHENKLETIFYAVKDAKDTEDLLRSFREMCYETFEFEEETDSYIIFKVIDVYEKTNYLKFKKNKRLVQTCSNC